MEKDGIDLIMDVLSSDDPWLRLTAISSLMRLGPIAQRTVPALKRVMEDPFELFVFRLNSAGAISHISPEDTAPLPVLIEGLSDPVGLNRALACQFLGDRRDMNSVLRAAPLMCDPEFSVRFHAAEAIGKNFDYWFHAVALCVEELKSNDPIARFSAQECLYSLGPDAMSNLDVLTDAMQTVDWQVRLDMEEALDELRRG